MRHPAFTRTTERPLLRASRSALLAATLGASVMLAPAALAQEATPAPSPVASPAAAAQPEAQVTTLMQQSFEEFVPAPITIRMLRITLEPGATTPMHTHPGPEFDLIESGELTIRTEGDAQITRATGDTEAATAEEQVLAAGDSIVYQPGTGMFFQNNGDAPVVMLSAVLLPVGSEFPESITYTDGQPTSQDFEGVSFVVLGDGLVQDMPAGGATVSINQVVLPAGADLPAFNGVAMYSRVSGNLSFIVDSGAVQVSRSELQRLEPNAVAGEEFILETGDAAFFPNGVSATSRADETGDLEMLVLSVEFAEEFAGDPAALTFTTGSSATGDATGGADTPDTGDDTAGAGQIVTSNVDDLNMRAEPSTSADVVDQLAAGVELEVLDGPVEAEEYTWYQVRVTATGGNTGWVAQDFLDGLQAPAAEATPVPDDTAAEDATDGTGETAAPAGGTFAAGDTVVTTEDNVRIRSEGSLAGNIVNAFPAGTEYQITGDPVEADGYTWYPVALVSDESITGWMPADFLAPAE